MSDFDSPWKEVLDRFFRTFLAFFFPEVHDAIDWNRGYESLDKELQQILREAELGRRLADKLLKVWRLDGQEAWVLVHIEVQSQPDAEFVAEAQKLNMELRPQSGAQVSTLAKRVTDTPKLVLERTAKILGW